jgi:opacity protein-like surface antigen
MAKSLVFTVLETDLKSLKINTMRNLLIIIFLLISHLSILRAQNYLGGGLSFGSGIEDIEDASGIQIRYLRNFNEQFGLNVNTIFYLYDKDEVSEELLNIKDGVEEANVVEFNANVLLQKEINAEFTLYGQFGLNYLSMNIEFENGQKNKEENELGFNLGVGMLYSVSNNISLYLDGKRSIKGSDQFVFSIGAVYEL